MPTTLNQIASAVDNNVRSGVKGVANYSYSMEQLEKEAVLAWAGMLEVMSKKPLFRTDGFTMEINALPLDSTRLSKVTLDTPGKTKIHFRIPALLNALEERAIEYIGPVSREGFGYRVYIGADHSLHQYRPVTSGKCYVYIDPAVGSDGKVDGWLMNYRGTAKNISISAVFADPEMLREFVAPGDGDDIMFPAPEEMVNKIIDNLTNKYLQYYRKLRAPVQNNDQTDKSS